jgi:uncharacterized membrane protein YeaQ/YmgE (transglycosylase-associated protein family)
MDLNAGGIVAWLVAGLIAGWLIGLFMKGSGYGLVWDLVLGLLGAVVGGWLFSFFVHGDVGFWGSIGIAFVGGCILVAIARAVAPGRPL